MASPPRPYSDRADLTRDLQRLLSDATLADRSISVEGEVLALHSQVLCARAPYFAALLSPRWAGVPLRKPNASARAVRDLLEFLVTGAVRLDDRVAAVRLSVLADEVGVRELAEVAAGYAGGEVGLRGVVEELGKSGGCAWDGLEAVIRSAVSKWPKGLVDGDLRGVWRLWAAAVEKGEMGRAELEVAVCELARVGRAKLENVLESVGYEERLLLYRVLESIPAGMFARLVEPLGVVGAGRVLEKYRADAVAAGGHRGARKSSQRVLVESSHPHGRGWPVSDSGECWVRRPVRFAGASCITLTFDPRSRLGLGANLEFFPSKDSATPLKVLAGDLPLEVKLFGEEVWYTLLSLSQEDCEAVGIGTSESEGWGWRFFAAPEYEDEGASVG